MDAFREVPHSRQVSCSSYAMHFDNSTPLESNASNELLNNLLREGIHNGYRQAMLCKKRNEDPTACCQSVASLRQEFLESLKSFSCLRRQS